MMTHFTFHRFYDGLGCTALVLAALLVSCGDNPVDNTDMQSAPHSFDIRVNSSWRDGNVTSRGIVVTAETFPDSFGLFATYYGGEEDNENSTGNLYARNVEIREQGAFWQATGNDLNWIGAGHTLFNAYTPYNAETSGVSYTEAGLPCLNFTVTAVVEEQTDLLVAKADSHGRESGTVELEFNHMLSAITLRTGEAMPPGKISRVTISGVYGSGKLELNTGNWSVTGDPNVTYSADITLTFDTEEDGSYTGSGLNIAGNGDNLTFFMIPQQLGADARLSIVFTDKATNEEHTLSASIGGEGKEWKSGQMYTYSISSPVAGA